MNSKNGWIKPSEQLPKIDENVIVTCKGGLVCLGSRIHTGGWVFIDTEYWYGTDNEVLAWQPLPKPYEV